MLPTDLPMSSVSIYFGYIVKSILSNYGSQVYLKWPNDFYIKKDKVGGLITNKKKDLFFIGVGLNLIRCKKFNSLDITFDKDEFLLKVVEQINSTYNWKSVFELYKLEFCKYNEYHFANIGNKKVYLKDALLNKDGSISINGKTIYSLR